MFLPFFSHLGISSEKTQSSTWPVAVFAADRGLEPWERCGV